MPTAQYLTWSAFLFTSDAGCKILVDPCLAGNPEAGIAPSPITAAELVDVDLVLVSHASWDHLGQALDVIKGGHARLGSSSDVWLQAVDAGITPDRRVNMIVGNHFRIADVTVIAVPAKHISVSRLKDGQWLLGSPLSFFLQFDGGPGVFFGGDTQISIEFDLYRRLYNPSIAVLGVSGVPHIERPPTIELPPAEAALAASMLGVSSVIPCHCLPGDPIIGEVAAACAASEKPIRCVPLAQGQRIDLDTMTTATT